jgi:phospholipase C/sugar lactone lactonase YvrE
MRCARIILLLLFAASASAQSLNFGQVNVGTSALVQILSYSFASTTTLSAVSILTLGAPGFDYADGGGSTCTIGTAYNAGQNCVVTVAFTPLAPGLRSGGVTLFAQGSNLPLVTWYLNGVGLSSGVTIDPGAQSTIATLSNNGVGYGSAIDGAGNLYVADHASSQVIEIVAGTFTQNTVVSSGLLNPAAVALDGAGNLYISDAGNSRVLVVPNEQGGLNSADITIPNISGLGSPSGLATDGGGNLYVADAANGQVLEVPAGGGQSNTLASGLNSPQGIAVDAAGNVYASSGNTVNEYLAGGGTPITMGGGYNNPQALAVDASGEVYVADTGNSRIVTVSPGGASQAALPATGLISPQGIALDAFGDVYITDIGNVYELNRTQAAALTLANTSVGSTSVPQNLTISDSGNQLLTVSNLAIAQNFTQVPSGGTNCTSGIQLSSAGQCLIAVAFDPSISGLLAGAVTLTDNALDNQASTQTVQLSGIGLPVAQTIMFATIPSQTYGAGSIALGATASSGLPVSYTVISGPASMNGNLLAIAGAGLVTVQANQAGNAQFAAAAPVSQSFTINPATTTVVWSNPAAISYGTPLSTTQLDSSASPVTAGAYSYSPPAGTVLNTGTQTLSVQFIPSNSNYAASNGSVTIQVTQASQTITFPTIPSQTYGAGSIALGATASSGLPVSYTLISGPAVINGGTLMSTGAGSVTVQASQAGNINYAAAAPLSQTFTVNPGSQTIAFTQGAPSVAPYDGSFTVAATASSGLPVALSGSGTCTNVGGIFTMTNSTGTCSVTASQPGNSDYLAASQVVETTNATKATPTTTFTGAPASAPYESTFSVSATSNSGATPSITASSPCSIKSSVVTMTSGTGSCTLTANWPANTYYLAASLTQTTTAQKLASTVSWPMPAPVTYPTSLSATQLDATANVPGTFAYSPKAGSILNAGNRTLNVTFTPSQSLKYATATANAALQVNQATPVITWPTPATIVYGTPLSTQQLDATAPIAGAFVYSPKAGTVPNAGSQTLSVRFTPSSNSNYTAANYSVTILVNQASQTITFAPIPNQTDGAKLALNAIASSGLPVSYTISGPATINGNLLTITGPGSVTVQATQSGSINYAAAIPISQAFVSSAGNVAQFNHVVIVDQENRTPDNLFQGLCSPPFGSAQTCSTTPTSTQYNIQTANWLDKSIAGGIIQPLTVPLANSYDLGHAHGSWLAQCDLVGGQCLMDGAAGVVCQPNSGTVCPAQSNLRYAYNPSAPTQLYPYLTLATQYGWANLMFQTNQGPSFPSHQFLFGGTSAPSAADDAAHIYAVDNGLATTLFSVGCIAPEASTVGLIAPSGTLPRIYPCFEHETLADLMSDIGTWRYYAPATMGGNNQAGSNIWVAPNAISHICQSTGYDGTCAGWGTNVVLNPSQVLTDVANCELASLSWVIPAGQNSDHAADNTGGGPDWVTSIVNAIGSNPQCADGETYWTNTAILITWDDWGGWYDHVAPQIIDEFQYGFRVPLIFVSAYTPSGYIDNTNHDFGSILRFVEGNFGIAEGSLGFADARAEDDLSSFYNLAITPRSFTTVPTQATIKSFIEDRTPPTAPDDD